MAEILKAPEYTSSLKNLKIKGENISTVLGDASEKIKESRESRGSGQVSGGFSGAATALSSAVMGATEDAGIPPENQRLNATLESLGIDADFLGLEGVTKDTKLGEALKIKASYQEVFDQPEEPVLYSKQLSSLNQKLKQSSENLRGKTREFGTLQRKLDEKKEELRRQQFDAQLEFAADVTTSEHEKLIAAVGEEAKIKEIRETTQKDLSLYTDGIKDAFTKSQKLASTKPGMFGDVLGFFDDNDNFSATKTLSTLFWLGGVFGNTFLSIGTEGKIPNYFMPALFKAIGSDFKAKQKHTDNLRAMGQLASTGLGATMDRFRSTVDQENAYRSAIHGRINQYIDLLASDPKLIKFKDNPLFQKSISLWKQENNFIKKESDFKIANTIQSQTAEEVSKRGDILNKASAAQQREFGQKMAKAEFLKSMLAPKNKKITELTNQDKEFYISSRDVQDKVQEAKALVDMLEQAGGAGASQLSLKSLGAKVNFDRYFGNVNLETRMKQLGQQLGRAYARMVDVGNLSQSEQEFGQKMAFEPGQNLDFVKLIINDFETRNVRAVMSRYMLTNEPNQRKIRTYLNSIGINDPEKIVRDTVENGFLPTQSEGYNATFFKESYIEIYDDLINP